MLMKHGDLVSAYFPADANSMLVTLEDCMQSTNRMNIIVAGKNYLPQWRTLTEAREQQKRGVATWDFASHKNPHIVLTSAGDYPTQESLAAVNILRHVLPKVRVRYVNISELTSLGIGDEKQKLSTREFVKFFTKDKPIIFNFHGYPSVIQRMFFGRSSAKRVQINGYTEEGSTTTPFDLQIRNKTSRYHLVLQSVEFLKKEKVIPLKQYKSVKAIVDKKLRQHREYIELHGVDPEEIAHWRWGHYPAEFV
jgi:xylulose-5-phosphate/fructose-6-phosphate phosphoketolase